MKKHAKPKKSSMQQPESTYWTEITFMCPKRGKVTERVEVKRLKPQPIPEHSPGYELEILKEDLQENDE